MYNVFSLSTNLEIKRDSRSRFYYLHPRPEELESVGEVLPTGKNNNYIFTHENGVDSHYLLRSRAPSIGNEAKLINLGTKIERCFDIVFISNGEANAEEHYKRLEALNLPNRLVRCKDVKGRNNAYKEAARLSNTPYFFAVFAKIEINPDFDFSFGAEEFDKRHYVFRATNPVNGLEYGHQGMILYNKEQVLANPGTGLDFTMSQLYREIPLVSGIAHFNFSELAAWRTAFREVLKLLISDDEVSLFRAGVWQTGQGPFSEFSIKGAKDAIDFYTDVSLKPDPMTYLMKSYDWDWLESYFNNR